MEDEMYLDDYYGLNDSAYNQQRTCDEISQFVQDALEDGESDEDILDFLNEEFDEETVSEGLQQLNQDLQDALFQHRGAPSKPKRSDFKTNEAYKKAMNEYKEKYREYTNRQKRIEHEGKSNQNLKKAENLADRANAARERGGLHKLSAKYNQFKAGRKLYKSRKEAEKAGKYGAKQNGTNKKIGKYEAGAKWDKKVGYDVAQKTTKKSKATRKGAAAGGLAGASTATGLIGGGGLTQVGAAGATKVALGTGMANAATAGTALAGAGVGAAIGGAYAAGKHVYNRTRAGAALAKSRRKKSNTSKKK